MSYVSIFLSFIFFIFRRELSRPIEEDVDKYLEKGIEAINKEAWRNEYCKKYTLVFKDQKMEQKVLNFILNVFYSINSSFCNTNLMQL